MHCILSDRFSLFDKGVAWISKPIITMSHFPQNLLLDLLYTALIWSAKNLLYSPTGGYLCFFEFGHSSTQTLCLSLHRYLFEGCYFGAIMGSANIAKIKCL